MTNTYIDSESSIADLLQTFRRHKRMRIEMHPDVATTQVVPRPESDHEVMSDVNVQVDSNGPFPDMPGFLSTHLCCTVCHAIKPVASFYPSNIRRSAFYCKDCSKTKMKMNSKLHLNSLAVPLVAVKQKQTVWRKDTALKMLDRLRRMCARPATCGLRRVVLQPISLGFDGKIARKLLEWWQQKSALSSPVMNDDTSDVATRTIVTSSTSSVVAASELDSAVEIVDREHPYHHEPDMQLRFIPWQKIDALPLQPWEVIPVTRAQARRLTAIPKHLWKDCLDPTIVDCINNRLEELKRLIQVSESSPVPQQ